jgi:hypothetical protein
VYVLTPALAVPIVKEAFVVDVAEELVPPPIAVPDVPEVEPPIVLAAEVLVEPVAIKQLVFTVREAPEQIDTLPNVPPATLRSAVTPFTTVRFALSGRGFTITVYEVVVLLQPAVVRHWMP